MLHALDGTPSDGVVFASFGSRVAVTGLRPTDVIVGVDQWRVRSWWQYAVAARFSLDPAMTFTVWRNGRYQQIKATVPERWFGVRLQDYRGRPNPRG
jgi:hypothetical protein